jgi:hypothetical protein
MDQHGRDVRFVPKADISKDECWNDRSLTAPISTKAEEDWGR